MLGKEETMRVIRSCAAPRANRRTPYAGMKALLSMTAAVGTSAPCPPSDSAVTEAVLPTEELVFPASEEVGEY